MLPASPYTPDFFKAERSPSERSAEVLVPMVTDLFHPQSVIDIGCGTGSWLSVFMRHGVTDVTGVDGAWVKPELLTIPQDRFLSHDLQKLLILPRRFELVVCLEVAEHVPPECADVLVESLARLGPIVLFSAAIPYQGGVAHLNEQWPEYWRARFEKRGFLLRDWLRSRVWNDDRVEGYYAQNTLLYIQEDRASIFDRVWSARSQSATLPLRIVHPRVYLRSLENLSPTNLGLRTAMAALPRIARTALGRRLKGALTSKH